MRAPENIGTAPRWSHCSTAAAARTALAIVVPKNTGMNRERRIVELIDCIAEMPWGGAIFASAGMMNVEKAKNSPATSPLPIAQNHSNDVTNCSGMIMFFSYGLASDGDFRTSKPPLWCESVAQNQRLIRYGDELCVSTMVAMLQAISRTPVARRMSTLARENFSRSTSSVNAAIHATFITPTTNSMAMSTQQQPTHHIPCRTPNTKGVDRE